MKPIKRFAGLSAFVMMGCCVFANNPSILRAQEPEAQNAANTKNSLAQQVQTLLSQIPELTKKDPQEALNTIEHFLNQNPTLTPMQTVWIRNAKARVYADSGNIEKALATYDEEMKVLEKDSNASALTLLSNKMKLLNSQKRFAETEAAFKPFLSLILQGTPIHYRAHYMQITMLPYIHALQAQNRASEILPVLRTAANNNLPYLGDSKFEWLYERLTETLLNTGGTEEALSWAKLHFMLCDFNEKSINHATQLILKSWMARDLTPAAGQNFLKAQQDAAQDNPLKSVKLPLIDAAALEQQAGRIHPKLVSAAITGDLLRHDTRSAMLRARRLMMDNPEDPTGLQEVCRVFKANDLSVNRANNFIQYYKDGTGKNELNDFLQEKSTEEKG